MLAAQITFTFYDLNVLDIVIQSKIICDQILTIYDYYPQTDSCTTQNSKLGRRYQYKTYETYIFLVP